MRQLLKRGALLVLAAVLLLGSAPGLLVPQAEAAGTFSDVSDLTMAQNIEVLQLMGVVDGMSGTSFDPSGTLTRAQFCKMAVEAMGQGDRVNIYKNYTIFPDVKPGHWASGYINLASRLTAGGEAGSSEEGGRATRLISGYSDGTFGPNRTVTYGQAITILMRMLGYGDSDVSVVWPDGYIDQAMAIGLSDGVKLSGASAINRGQAVRLFVNLLNCATKSGRKFYYTLGDVTEDVILLDANGKNDAGQPVLKINNNKEYIIAGKPGAGLLAGSRGAVVADGEIAKAFIPSNKGSSKSITVAKAEALTITDTHGTEYKVSNEATMVLNNETKKYAENFSFLRSGTLANIYIGAGGRVESVFVGTTTSDDAVIIAKNGGTGGFSLLTDRTDYKIYKHGEEVRAKDLKEFDVATYSSSNNTIYISDNRITVYYQDAYPNTQSPIRIKGTGIADELEVMSCALESLSQCKIGDTITLLLTENNKVAGVSTSNAARGNAIGFVGDKGLTLFNGLKVDTEAIGSLENYKGQLVSVYSSNKRSMTVSKFSSKGASGDLNVSGQRVGSTPLAMDVVIYEKAGTSALTQVTLSDLAGNIPSEKIAFAHKNSMGKVDIIVLENASGAAYIYGRMEVTEKTTSSTMGDITNRMVTVHYYNYDTGRSATSGPYYCAAFRQNGQWGGIIPAGDGERVSAYVILEEIKNVSTSSFRSDDLLYHNGTTYEVSDKVTCYNKATGQSTTLGAALAFSETCSVYIDSNNVVRGVEVGK